MKEIIIDDISVLAKLALSEEEKRQAEKDMLEMLAYADKLKELDTSGAEPMTHIFSMTNVFREDDVTDVDGRADTLFNAPEKTDSGFVVPRTIG